MKWPIEKYEDTKIKIRQMLVKMPNLSPREIGEGLGIDRKTVYLLLSQIRKENIEHIDEKEIKDEIAKLEQHTGFMVTEIWALMQDPTTKAGQKLYGIKVLSDILTRLHEAKMDAGIFKRHIGTVDVQQNLNIIDLLQNASPETKKQFSELAKQLIRSRRNIIEGSVVPTRPPVSDRRRNLPIPPESDKERLEAGGTTPRME